MDDVQTARDSTAAADDAAPVLARVAALGPGLAAEAGLSIYHFVRTFRRVTGVTPHQFLMRTRLRRAAVRLASQRAKIIDVTPKSYTIEATGAPGQGLRIRCTFPG